MSHIHASKLSIGLELFNMILYLALTSRVQTPQLNKVMFSRTLIVKDRTPVIFDQLEQLLGGSFQPTLK